MNTYFIRTVEADYPQLIALGVLLGAIVHIPRSENTYEREIYEEVLMQPGDECYDDYDHPHYRLMPTGRFETVTEVTEERIYAPNGAWDPIGPIPTQVGEIDGEPIMEPLKDPQGNEYIHINLLTPLDLKAVAVAMAADHPEVAEGLSNLGKFFLLDAEGNARAPAQPYRVFAS